MQLQQRVEGGETVIVGVNQFTDDSDGLSIPSPDYAGVAAASVKQGSAPPLMPLVINAVRARASVGEISDALAGAWGRYVPA